MNMNHDSNRLRPASPPVLRFTRSSQGWCGLHEWIDGIALWSHSLRAQRRMWTCVATTSSSVAPDVSIRRSARAPACPLFAGGDPRTTARLWLLDACGAPAAFCRLDEALVRAVASEREGGRIVAAALALVIAGSAVFGAGFGYWRAPEQAVYSAVKMPLLILTVTAFSAAINTLLAQVLGARLSFRQVLLCMMVAFAITSVLLAAVSPVTLLFALQAPPVGSPSAMTAYRVLLLLNTSAVGLCGILGNVQLFRLLAIITGSPRLAGRVLAAWIMVAGLTGCELSWLFSPFLARPDIPIPFTNPLAFLSNFFEYVYHAAFGGVEGLWP